MNQSEQIVKLTSIVARMNTGGSAMHAGRALGWATAADLGMIAKSAGVSLEQLELWVGGQLELPVDQTLKLLDLCQQFALGSLGLPAAALTNGSHP